jgi:hypothetical protein
LLLEEVFLILIDENLITYTWVLLVHKWQVNTNGSSSGSAEHRIAHRRNPPPLEYLRCNDFLDGHRHAFRNWWVTSSFGVLRQLSEVYRSPNLVATTTFSYISWQRFQYSFCSVINFGSPKNSIMTSSESPALKTDCTISIEMSGSVEKKYSSE